MPRKNKFKNLTPNPTQKNKFFLSKTVDAQKEAKGMENSFICPTDIRDVVDGTEDPFLFTSDSSSWSDVDKGCDTDTDVNSSCPDSVFLSMEIGGGETTASESPERAEKLCDSPERVRYRDTADDSSFPDSVFLSREIGVPSSKVSLNDCFIQRPSLENFDNKEKDEVPSSKASVKDTFIQTPCIESFDNEENDEVPAAIDENYIKAPSLEEFDNEEKKDKDSEEMFHMVVRMYDNEEDTTFSLKLPIGEKIPVINFLKSKMHSYQSENSQVPTGMDENYIKAPSLEDFDYKEKKDKAINSPSWYCHSKNEKPNKRTRMDDKKWEDLKKMVLSLPICPLALSRKPKH